MAGFNIFPRSKQSCHCLTRTGLGAMSQVGIVRMDMLRMLPEQNAEAVMPIVWATRIAAGRGAIATKCSEKLVDAWIV